MTPFEIDQRARKCLSASLPDSWTMSSPVDDIGLDYWVQVTDSGQPSGLSFFIQLKGTTSPRFTDDALSFSLYTKKLVQYLETSLPVLFVLCKVDANNPREDTPYYCWIRNYVREVLCSDGTHPEWFLSQQSVTINIPVSMTLSPEICLSRLLSHLKTFHVRHSSYEDRHIEFFQRAKNIAKGLRQYDEDLASRGIELEPELAYRAKQYYVVGRFLQQEAKHPEALCYFQMVNEICPVSEAYLCQSFSYEAVNDLPSAMDACLSGLELDPGNSYLWSNLGTLHFANGNLKEAFGCHDRAARLNNDDAFLISNVGATLEYLASTSTSASERDQFLQRSLAFYEKAVQIDDSSDFILADMGLVLFKLYKFPVALKCFRKAVQINPYNVTAWIRYGRAALAYGDLHTARIAVDHLNRLGVNSKEVSTLSALLQQYSASSDTTRFVKVMRMADEMKMRENQSKSEDSGI